MKSREKREREKLKSRGKNINMKGIGRINNEDRKMIKQGRWKINHTNSIRVKNAQVLHNTLK